MEALDRAVKALDGVGRLAHAIGVGQSVVSNWRSRGSPIDPRHCTAIERATGGTVRRWHLRPTDWHLIWPELIGADAAPEVPAEPSEVRDAA